MTELPRSGVRKGALASERAECSDCRWEDRRPGARGRGSQHHTRTGHEVVTTRVKTYLRRVAIAGQTSIFDLLGGEADAHH